MIHLIKYVFGFLAIGGVLSACDEVTKDVYQVASDHPAANIRGFHDTVYRIPAGSRCEAELIEQEKDLGRPLSTAEIQERYQALLTKYGEERVRHTPHLDAVRELAREQKERGNAGLPYSKRKDIF